MGFQETVSGRGNETGEKGQPINDMSSNQLPLRGLVPQSWVPLGELRCLYTNLLCLLFPKECPPSSTCCLIGCWWEQGMEMPIGVAKLSLVRPRASGPITQRGFAVIEARSGLTCCWAGRNSVTSVPPGSATAFPHLLPREPFGLCHQDQSQGPSNFRIRVRRTWGQIHRAKASFSLSPVEWSPLLLHLLSSRGKQEMALLSASHGHRLHSLL